VILTQDVKSQGKKGQLIEVSEGYGRNYLLPRKLATEATADNMNKMKLQDKARLAREAAEKAEAEAVGTQLEGILVKVSGKAGTGGRLFGSITTKEIADALKEQFQIDIPKTKLVQDDPIKAFGTYQIKCKLGYEVTGTVNVLVTEEK
ncbi:MAG: 50S ribosomal protein L9, partial [Oscillospiraceae bacterium]